MIKKLILPSLLLTAAALSGCGAAPVASDPLSNPLYAQWYYKDLTEGMMALEIREDPILQDERMKQKVDSIRRDALAKSQEVASLMRKGRQGPLMQAEEEVVGRALLLDSVLYFSPETNIRPGYELHVFLTTKSDPLGGSGAVMFPNADSIDLGVMRMTYGASQIVVPETEGDPYRAVVLWDVTLKRVHAFAQLQ